MPDILRTVMLIVLHAAIFIAGPAWIVVRFYRKRGRMALVDLAVWVGSVCVFLLPYGLLSGGGELSGGRRAVHVAALLVPALWAFAALCVRLGGVDPQKRKAFEILLNVPVLLFTYGVAFLLVSVALAAYVK